MKIEWDSYLPQHFREPLAMIAIRSPSSSASSIEWVVSKIILPFFIFLINCHVKRIEYGSIPLVGSSRTITWDRWWEIINTNFSKNKDIMFQICFSLYYLLSGQFQETISSSCHQKAPSQQCLLCQPNPPEVNKSFSNLITRQKRKNKIIKIFFKKSYFKCIKERSSYVLNRRNRRRRWRWWLYLVKLTRKQGISWFQLMAMMMIMLILKLTKIEQGLALFQLIVVRLWYNYVRAQEIAYM